jgi:hypothetical protein
MDRDVWGERAHGEQARGARKGASSFSSAGCMVQDDMSDGRLGSAHANLPHKCAERGRVCLLEDGGHQCRLSREHLGQEECDVVEHWRIWVDPSAAPVKGSRSAAELDLSVR